MKKSNFTGKVFGRLTVTGQSGLTKTGHSQWRCVCECGNEVDVRGTSLSQGHVKSCGCLRSDNAKEKSLRHGLYYHSSYSTWRSMMTRCFNTNSDDYAEYGARGITVCERWKDVANFIADMGERPAGASIDRIDNSKGYEPGNCRWSNPVLQSNNTRRNVYYEHAGKRLTVSQWERELGISRGTLWLRLKNGHAFEHAIDPAFKRGAFERFFAA